VCLHARLSGRSLLFDTCRLTYSVPLHADQIEAKSSHKGNCLARFLVSLRAAWHHVFTSSASTVFERWLMCVNAGLQEPVLGSARQQQTVAAGMHPIHKQNGSNCIQLHPCELYKLMKAKGKHAQQASPIRLDAQPAPKLHLIRPKCLYAQPAPNLHLIRPKCLYAQPAPNLHLIRPKCLYAQLSALQCLLFQMVCAVSLV